MVELPKRHPVIAKEFNDSKFVVHKTRQVFSSIRHMNRIIKGDGGAVGLSITLVLCCVWMIAGPEVSRVVEEFHKEFDYCACKTNTGHHDYSSYLW